MKILCGLSGIEFQCDHFPAYLHARESHHPIFNIPQRKLLSFLPKWASGELTTTDNYLLFLAILNSSDLVEFRTPAVKTPFTDSIVAQNMESLVRTIIKLNTVTNPAVVFPRYVITPETKTLSNVKYWIENWKEAHKEFLDGYRSAHTSEKLVRREAALERMIKNPHKPIASYASQIADWAAIAGSFPNGNIPSPFTQLQIPLSQYWKEIIIRCANETSLFSIPRTDLDDLLEHCEQNIPVGSIYSNALFRILRHALERQKNFLGLGDLDISRSTYQILESSDDAESANIRAMIDAAPDHEPKPDEYPTKFAYLKAKLRWDMSRKLARNGDAS
jgi:hypothetical protein